MQHPDSYYAANDGLERADCPRDTRTVAALWIIGVFAAGVAAVWLSPEPRTATKTLVHPVSIAAWPRG